MAMINLGVIGSSTGELWGEVKGGGRVHLGTFHMDNNTFIESDEDGIVGTEHDISTIDETITVKGTWELHGNDFEIFRMRWLQAKYPSIDWYGGRRIHSVSGQHSLGTN